MLPMQGALGSIPGQRTRSCMLQLRPSAAKYINKIFVKTGGFDGGGVAVPRGVRIKDWLNNRMLTLMISETEENFDKEHRTSDASGQD